MKKNSALEPARFLNGTRSKPKIMHCSLKQTLAVLTSSWFALNLPQASAQTAESKIEPAEEWVLNYHLMHPGGPSSPGDPNPAFFLDGVCHLHYILRHPWQGAESFSFVHVTSDDMLHWRWQPTKLQPAFTGHGMFSGTGFMTLDGRPAAIYHGKGSNRNQIAIATDRSISAWEKPFPLEIKNADGSDANITHWGPDCFTIGDTYYAISGGTRPPLFKSKDLKTWMLVGDFLHHDMPDVTVGEDISCPNFFKLGNKWVLLCISHPLGCRYYIGDWDAKAEQFVPEKHVRMNWRRDDQPAWGLFNRTDFFAPESVLTPDGRRVMWSWLASIGPKRGLMHLTIQSLPRELSLPADGVLRIQPLRELEAQRTGPVVLNDVKLASPVTGFGGRLPPTAAPELQRVAELPAGSAELCVTITQDEAARKLLGFTLFSDGKGGGLPILLRPETGTLRVGNTEVPFAVAGLPAGEDVELRIFIDNYLVEVFANGRQAVVAAHLEQANQRGMDAYCIGAPTTLKKVEIWKLKPTNEGFREAQKNRIWLPETGGQ